MATVNFLICLVVTLIGLCAALASIPHCSMTSTVTVDLYLDGTCDSLVDKCSSLQSAINAAVLASGPTHQDSDCIEILIPDGTHYITTPVPFTLTNIHFTGTGQAVNIYCDYTNHSEDYTWYFDHLSSAVFENLQFEGCPYPFRFDGVTNVIISNCSFRFFSEAVLDIFNCQEVLLANSDFENNSGTGILLKSYRGNTGGVAIGINSVSASFLSSPSVQISNCTFVNNSALAISKFHTISQTAFNQVFTGRGGGLGVFVNESFFNVTLEISDCTFANNFARSFGGGIYILLNGRTAQHITTVERTSFLSNVARLHGGGGMQLSYLSNGIAGSPHTTNFTDCTFQNNKAEGGGGIYVFTSFQGSDGNFFKFQRCIFTGNKGSGTHEDYGAAVLVSLLTPFQQRVALPRHEVVDCIFSSNIGPNGIISIGYAPLKFMGVNRFIANRGSAVRIVGSVVDLGGNISFINNSVGDEGGAIHLLSFGQIRFNSGLNMSFIGNQGRFGASIFSDSTGSSAAFTKLVYNPQCFALYETPSSPPANWNDVSLTFRDNVAVLGSALYIKSQLDTCSWFSLTSPFFNDTYILNWPVWNFEENINTGYIDSNNTGYDIETAAERLVSNNSVITAWPGQKFSLSLTGINHFGYPTTVNVRLAIRHHSASNLVRFGPEIVVIDGNSEDGTLIEEFTLVYGISNTSVLSENDSLGEVNLEVPFESFHKSADSFELYPAPCPGGYTLTRATFAADVMVCTCDSIDEIVLCETDQDTIIIKNGYWAVYVPATSGSNLKFYPCPPGYCQCSHSSSAGNTRCVYTYTNSIPDSQCVCSREGVLCGGCKNENGVSVLLNKCVTCHDASALLIPALIIVDAVVFAVIVLLDKPIPTWVYPFLFYIQIAPYVAQYLPDSFDDVGKYAYFFGSASGFYFIYDFCLYSNMSPLVSYTIRFVPLFTALILCPTILFIRRKLRKRSLAHHGIWWILLLLYSHVVYTSMSILNCPALQGKDHHIKSRWFLSGEMECFTGGHIPLALLAIFTLLLCFLLVPVTLVVSLNLFKKPQWLEDQSVPLTENFKENMRWWSAIELGRRFLFLLFFIPFPRNTASPALVLAVIIGVYGFAQPYKDTMANLLEMFVQITFLVLLLLWTTPLIQENYFVFEAPTDIREGCVDGPLGIATITWILMPLYYLPVLVLLVMLAIFGGVYLSSFIRRTKDPEALDEDEAPLSGHVQVHDNVLASFQMVELEGKAEGFANLTAVYSLENK